MFLTKYPHRANFSFAAEVDLTTGRFQAGKREFTASLASYEGDVYHLRVANEKVWGQNLCLETLDVPPPSERARVKLNDGFEVPILGRDGKPLLKMKAGAGFGVSGEMSMFQFEVPEGVEFYGMGEKAIGRTELSGLRVKYWNVDAWGDFHGAQVSDHPTDPYYASVPYLVVKVGDEYVGLLLHNPYPTFMETPGVDPSRVFVEWQITSPTLLLGSEGGEPNLWILYGPTLPELTRKLQKLVGMVPLPPVWSLGYHQSRWGYGGHDDLVDLDKKFAENEIPCSGLWMDLDYMNGFRIFQTSDVAFPGGAQRTADILAKNGRRIVPILDPGVKSEPGNPVYDDGRKKNLFCLNAEGEPYIGMVWPGETVFPDLTMAEGRKWWAGYVKKFRKEGFGGTWVDMNDPSTGPVDPSGMLFNRGKLPHAAHRNQYALGMQMATREGFLQAFPNERPFILSRSGFIGSSKHSAIWTGDNFSNVWYLKLTVPTAINMSLSGLPFSGPDLGGFGGDAEEPIMLDWIRAGFLFPFCRNHCMKGARNQEPFAYRASAMRLIRRYIRLRYKMMPYLYGLFVDLEETGEPVLRPLFYHFEGKDFGKINDQFMIGPSILQAPFLDPAEKTRSVTLPGDGPWYDAATGEWVASGEHTVKRDREATPLYVAPGALIPMQPGTPTTAFVDLRKANVHVFVPPTWTGEAEVVLRADDGLTFDYQKGVRTAVRVKAKVSDEGLALTTETLMEGYGPIQLGFVIHGEPKSVTLNGEPATLKPGSATLSGKPLRVHVVA